MLSFVCKCGCMLKIQVAIYAHVGYGWIRLFLRLYVSGKVPDMPSFVRSRGRSFVDVVVASSRDF